MLKKIKHYIKNSELKINPVETGRDAFEMIVVIKMGNKTCQQINSW